MSVSVDNDKLQAVMQFASFLEVLRDPSGLQATLADLAKATAENQASVEARTKLSKLDQYILDQQKEVAALKAQLQKDTDALAVQVAENVRSQGEFAAYVTKANNDLAVREAAVAVSEKSSKAREEAVAKVEKDQTDTAKGLQTLKDSLDNLKAELDAKARKLQELLG